MSVVFEREGAKERIINNALALCGLERDERCEAVFEVVLLNALAYCNRDDVPYKMEGALAALLADGLKNGGGREVRSLTRGDVSVTYSDKSSGMKGELGAFVKLGVI